MAYREVPLGGSMQDDKDWQAESDLRTLIEAEKIKADEKRLKAAMRKRKALKKNLDSMEK